MGCVVYDLNVVDSVLSIIYCSAVIIFMRFRAEIMISSAEMSHHIVSSMIDSDTVC